MRLQLKKKKKKKKKKGRQTERNTTLVRTMSTNGVQVEQLQLTIDEIVPGKSWFLGKRPTF